MVNSRSVRVFFISCAPIWANCHKQRQLEEGKRDMDATVVKRGRQQVVYAC